MSANEHRKLNEMSTQWDEEYDIVILGAGAGGMTTALVSAIEGLRVLLIEKSDQIGGTTARSSGTVWVPDNHHQRRLGIIDDAGAALAYLDALVGSRADRALRKMFIASGSKMIRYLERHTNVHFQPYPHQPDYRQDLPGPPPATDPLNRCHSMDEAWVGILISFAVLFLNSCYLEG